MSKPSPEMEAAVTDYLAYKTPRVHWTVSFWGPRAADDPNESISGAGETPEMALANLVERMNRRGWLLEQFREWAEVEMKK